MQADVTDVEVPTSPGLVRALQTERLIAALIPPSSLSSAAPSDAPVVSMPLPRVPPPSADPAKVHRVACLDDHGRIRDAFAFAALGWAPGDAVRVAEHGDGLVARAGAAGVALDDRGRLPLPAPLRRFRGWQSRQPLLLTADATTDALFIFSTNILDDLECFRDHT